MDKLDSSPQELQALAAVALALAKDMPPDDPTRKQLLLGAKAVLDEALARLRLREQAPE